MQDNFVIKTELFEGPLDLLLNLIEKRKLLINDISLSKITDDYINFINSETNFSIKNRAEFILVASTLLLIKSKSLLPSLELSEEESQSIEDLEIRLKILKRIKEAEPIFLEKFGQKISFLKNHLKSSDRIIFTPGKLSAEMIKEYAKSVINSLPKFEKIPKIILQKVISLEEMIGNLTDRIKKNLSFSFKEFTKDKKEKVNIIVGFLAMLELVKNGMIVARQDNKFGDIDMETKEVSAPNYGE